LPQLRRGKIGKLMVPKSLSFIDVETTGTSSRHGRIIEIGIIRVEDGVVVDEFSSLINPDMTVDPFIVSMTGINPGELQNAPSFYAVKDRIKEILKDSLFVAHNVLFDYSFIKREFERLEESFSSKYFCTVKLSRKLYPRFSRHNLDSLIERHNLKMENRHRAMDDAKAIFEFYNLSLENFGEEKMSEVFNILMKRPSLPIGISEDVLNSLPEGPGVYIFYDSENTPLYVGKSINIRDRVMSHFSNSKREAVDMKIASNISRIETLETAGELGALLLEATMVKKLQPVYNRQLRHASKLLALKKTTLGNYTSVTMENLQDISVEELSDVLGIFKSSKEVKSFLTTLTKEYHLCLKLLGLEKTSKNCFNYHLGLCYGACSGKEKDLKYNLRFEEAFYKTKIKAWPFKGPIGIRERSSKEELFVIDKWCVLGKLKSPTDSLDDISRDYLFDRDTYKILNRYLNGTRDFEVFNIHT
jgi:DNA polymerase III subunit epsilon